MSNRVGQTIDARYKVERRLGTGGMADVFGCEDRQLGRHVAVKVLHENLAQDPTVVQRFRREASSAAGLQHPHIVSIFDRGDWEGVPYMAMELVDGTTLKDVIVDEAPLDPVRAIDWISQVLDALRYAHKRGLVHRDIKPQNVLVGPDGELKVADFGIARAVDDLQMTQTGMIVGTAHYLSPEQASGLPITPSADLYATGVVLFEMLTGRMPFDGDQPVAIALKHVNEQPPALRVVNPDVPADLERVVLRAMAKSVEQRFEDAEHFMAALQTVRRRILSGAPVPEAEDDTAFVAGAAGGPAYGPQQPTGGWLMPAADMAVPAGYDPEEAEEEAAARKKRRRAWTAVGGVVALLAIILVGWLAFGRMETVPDVTSGEGLTEAAATQRLEDKGFKVVAERRVSSNPRGNVYIQNPRAGTRKGRGSTVRIVVSAGARTIAVPNVANQSEDEATATLKRVGFTNVDTQDRASSSVAEGTTIETSPAAGTSAAPGARITLIVSTGPTTATTTTTTPETVDVPDVSGQTRAQARKALEDAGLTAGSFTTDETATGTQGRVAATDPGSGTSVERGTTVNVTLVGSGSTGDDTDDAQVEVPSVTGQSQAEATSALEQAGLKVRVKKIDTTEEDQDGQVLSQSPSGGRRSSGATVTINVGDYTAPSSTDDSQGATDSGGTSSAGARSTAAAGGGA